MGHIEVIYQPLQATDNFYHKILAVVHDNGTVDVLEGYPGSDYPGGYYGSIDFRDSSINITLEIFSFTYGSYARETIYTGGDTYVKSRNLIKHFYDVENANIGYDPLDTNSNWIVDRALYLEQIPLPKWDTWVQYYAPGSIEIYDAHLRHMHDPADHPAVTDAGNASGVRGQQWLKAGKPRPLSQDTSFIIKLPSRCCEA